MSMYFFLSCFTPTIDLWSISRTWTTWARPISVLSELVRIQKEVRSMATFKLMIKFFKIDISPSNKTQIFAVAKVAIRIHYLFRRIAFITLVAFELKFDVVLYFLVFCHLSLGCKSLVTDITDVRYIRWLNL